MLTPSERQWMQDARRAIRFALTKIEIGDWDSVVGHIKGVVRSTLVTKDTLEVTNLLASIASSEPSDFRRNAAMRAAALRRLEEAKTYIGDTLVATTDR
jgi:hypothetical protein